MKKMLTDGSCYDDVALLTYAYNVLIGGYCTILFTWWLTKVGRPSAWYLYVMGLILAIVISSGFQFVARFTLLIEHPFHEQLLNSTLWSIKSWIGGLTLSLVAVHATHRFFNRNKELNRIR